jgi:hypothetical protein
MAAMGAWGPAIFSDDTACDIRTEYRELLEDEVPDDVAMQRVIERYEHLDPDEEHVLWLALAAVQSQVGRLDDAVKARALAVIESGQGLDLWRESGPSELSKRNAALAKLQEKLTGPQPARKRIRRPWRYETDLEPGDVLRFVSDGGRVHRLRVARVDDNRTSASPVLEWVNWTDESDRSTWRPVRPDGSVPFGLVPFAESVLHVSRHRKKDPDWSDLGFTLETRLLGLPRDDQQQANSYIQWKYLARAIQDGSQFQ